MSARCKSRSEIERRERSTLKTRGNRRSRKMASRLACRVVPRPAAIGDGEARDEDDARGPAAGRTGEEAATNDGNLISERRGEDGKKRELGKSKGQKLKAGLEFSLPESNKITN